MEEAKRLLEWCRLYIVDRKGYSRNQAEERAKLGAELDAWLGTTRNPTEKGHLSQPGASVATTEMTESNED